MQKESKQDMQKEILTVRELPYRAAMVFSAWEDPAILAKWWGPDGFTNTFQKFEFRDGGDWEFVMHAADGTGYPNKNKFVSISREQIVMDHLEAVHRFRVTASFEEFGQQTRYSFHMLFDSADECQRIRSFILAANEQNIDRLEKQLSLLAKKQTP